ncbi:MAG: hypothetical protein IPN84_01510 [Sphingomonadales bacterium]|nr:hypothetical protein [Sphingomonadales bacterium]
MKEIIFGAVALGIVGVGVYKGAPATSAPDVYEMTQAEAVEKLTSKAIPKSSQAFSGPFGTMDVVTHTPSPDKITWSASGDHAAALCEVTLTPVETTHVRVVTECGSEAPSAGVTGGALNDIISVSMIEFVDSTLEDRPFNENVVMAASTAAFAKRYPTMVKDAVQMDMEMRKMQQEGNQGQ